MENKYKIGDTVWMTSDWFGGTYIPDCFIVADIRCINGKYQYRKKNVRKWWDEDKLYATEDECQIHEIQCFIKDTQKYAQRLVEKCRELGVGQQAVKLLTAPKKELPLPKNAAKKRLYNVGEHVWGHQYKGMAFDDYANPKEYIIAKRVRLSHNGAKWYGYQMKGYGSFIFDEDNIYPTKEEALLGNAKAMRTDAEGVLNGLKERCKTLNLPTQNLLLLENDND